MEIGSNYGMGLRLGFLVILLLLTRAWGRVAAGSEAYLMLLYGDEFLLGVCILGKSIRDTGLTKDMAVLVSDGVLDFTKRLLQETLKLIETFVDKAEDQPHIGKQFVPPMMDPVLGDYVKNVADARESEVLSLFATITNKYWSSTSPRGVYGCNSYFDAGGNADRYDDVRYGYKDDDWNRHGRERDYGYSDDDRYDKGGYSQSWDGDRYGRVNEDRHGRDGYRIRNTCIAD